MLAALLPAASWVASAASKKAAAREPGKAPSRIILTWAGDPTRTQAVSWRTDLPASAPQAQIAPLTGSPGIEENALNVEATVNAVSLPDGKSAAHYAVRFEGLKPATRYTYRVGDGSNWSEWNVFRTASDRPEPFRFLYLGDAQNDIHSKWSRTIRAAYAAVPDARMIVHAGDLLAEGYDDELWGEWCEALGFIGATIPSLPVPGNHDLHPLPGAPAKDNPLRASDQWHQHFLLPRNGPEGLEGQSYFIDYQGVRFISLDVNVFTGKTEAGTAKQQIANDQMDWLEKVLRENPNRWTVVFQHQPVYPIAKDRTANNIASLLPPVFDRYNVDLVLAGHDHAYGRSHKLRAGKPVPMTEPGTIYAVSVSGPKMYKLNPDHAELMAKTLAETQLYQVISIDRDVLRYSAYAIDGTPVDSFELAKPGPRLAPLPVVGAQR